MLREDLCLSQHLKNFQLCCLDHGRRVVYNEAVISSSDRYDVRILAVDDDPFIRDMLRHIIDSWGLATLATAESAERAILMITREETPFDCLLIDMRMLGVSGEELCSWVRTLPEYADTP
jgi:PleD family two-component response regulator